MSKHTPGPWEVARNAPYVNMGDGPSFGVVVFDAETSEETYYANARLIAAAPDLLAACKALLRDISGRDQEAGFKAIDLGLTAIARAEGGPT